MSTPHPVPGLTQQEVAQRLKNSGYNKLSTQEESAWQILFRQFTSPFIYLLALASAISIMLGEQMEGLMITLFVIINAGIGFIQEERSAHAIRELRKYISPRARVRRDGKEYEIPTEELVVDDIVLVKAGDRVSADAQIIRARALLVDESMLTGESEPVAKDTKTQNTLFSGTNIAMGSAEALVTATGIKTRLGTIAGHVIEHRPPGEFEKGISRFSHFILRMVTITLVIIFIANAILKDGGADLLQLLIFSIALAVSVIPEALPLVTSIALSRGALKLAKQKVVLKRLSAMENLGSIDVLCTDKTGTLTENKLTVHDVFGDRATVLQKALLGSSDFLHDGRKPENAFDAAIYDAVPINERNRQAKIIDEIPFDPTRRRNSLLYEQHRQRVLVLRGAPETLMDCCVQSDESLRIKVAAWTAAQGALGCRVIAIAAKKMGKKKLSVKDEKQLEFVGLIAFQDPIKPTASAAIKTAKELGIQVKILTGDSPEVAAAVAKTIGLIRQGEKIILGNEFSSKSEREKLHLVRTAHVFARTSPEQKYEIIKYVQKMGKDVGFLGEGINDVPALKRAEVGMVVQEASDIARESADVILLEASLLSIVNGIRLGREVFANTNTYLRATLTSNFGNFYAVAISTLFIEQLPMLPIQILLLNLLSDFPMIAISTDRPDLADLKKPKHYNTKEIIAIAIMLGSISTIFDFIFFAIFASGPIAVLQTNWFIGSVLTELALIYSIRSRGLFLLAKPPSMWLMLCTIPAMASAVLIPFTSFGSKLFQFQTPSMMHLVVIFSVVISYFITTELVKIGMMKTKFIK